MAVEAAEAPITRDNYRFLQQFASLESGIIIEDAKPFFFESRLGPVIQKHNIPSINVLCSMLRLNANPALRRDSRNVLTTNETLFFRDRHPFDVLQATIIPEILETNAATRRIRIWSAAASSGQEAYSLAMLLFEMNLQSWSIEIIGTDISDEVLEKARAGKYLRLETNRGLPASYLLKYFNPSGLSWQIKPEIQRCVDFRQFDLRSNPAALGTFDVIFCRNVLIYFDMETRRKILCNLTNALRPNGVLTLGSSEAVLDASIGLERRIIDPSVFYCRAGRKPKA